MNIKCLFGLHDWCKGHTRWWQGELCHTTYVCHRCKGGKQINPMGLLAN